MVDSQITSVVTSCRSRFWIFEQARELQRLGMLKLLIADYPKSWPARYGVPAEKVQSLLFAGFVNHGLGNILNYLPARQRDRATRLIHDNFSRQLAKLIPGGTQFFIGLSSFCWEALEECKLRGIPCAVDHASLHMADEKSLIAEESSHWGLPTPSDVCPDWVIEKEQREYSLADYIFVPSSAAKDSLIRHGVSGQKIFINSYGVDISAFRPTGASQEVFRVIQAGTVCMRKGVLTTLSAFTRARLPNAELLILGGGIEVSGMKQIILKMSSSNVVLRPAVPFSRLNEVYNTCSVMVLASVSDGFALVVIHAMACGIPVIITDNVGAKDLIRDGENGFIVPVGSPELIAERLKLLHNDPDFRRNMGLSARETVKAGFGWEDYGNRLGNFLRSNVQGEK